MKRLVLGIDPGLSGALAWLDPKANQIVFMYDSPVYKNGDKYEFDVPGAAQIISNHVADTDLAVVERVHSMPKQGVASTFKFGYTAGSVYGILCALGIPTVLTDPQSWKSAYGLIGCGKDESRFAAMRYWPAVEKHFSKKKWDGRAEACLIAGFGAQIHSIQAKLNRESVGEVN